MVIGLDVSGYGPSGLKLSARAFTVETATINTDITLQKGSCAYIQLNSALQITIILNTILSNNRQRGCIYK